MRLVIREATEQDKTEWDTFVSDHPKASPYHRYAWKESIEQAYGHQCHYFIAENTRHEIVGILPTAVIKPPFLGGQLCALPFCDMGGCLSLHDSIYDRLISSANKLVHDLHLKFFEHRTSMPGKSDILEGQKVRMLLEVPLSSKQLLGGFKSKLRSQIHKAEKNGLTFKIGCDDTYVDDFYEVYATNMHRLGSPAHSRQWFQAIKRNFCDQMIISTVWKGDIVIGAGIVLLNGAVASIPWASTKSEFNKMAPNMLLYWSVLSYAADHGYQVFDFGRSTYGEGTYKFKQQWGAKPHILSWETYVSKNSGYHKVKSTHVRSDKVRQILEFIWKSAPLRLATYAGSYLRKFISL